MLPTPAADSGELALGRAIGTTNPRTSDPRLSVNFYLALAAPPWAPWLFRQTPVGLLAKTPLPTPAVHKLSRITLP